MRLRVKATKKGIRAGNIFRFARPHSGMFFFFSPVFTMVSATSTVGSVSQLSTELVFIFQDLANSRV